MLILNIALGILVTAGLYLAVHTFKLIWIHFRLKRLALPDRRRLKDAYERVRLSKHEMNLTQQVTDAHRFCMLCVILVMYAALLH